MNGATAKALRPAQARNVQRILRGLGALWDAPALANIGVVANPRLSRTLGRLVGRQLRIEIGPWALGTSKRLREVVTHEGAHAVIATARGAARQAPHGARMATPLRGHTNILKWLLIHTAGFNLGLVMRTAIGVGTPRGLQGVLQALLAALARLTRSLRAVLDDLMADLHSHPLRPRVCEHICTAA